MIENIIHRQDKLQYGYCSFWLCVLPCAALKSYMLLSDATQRRAISDANANAYSVFCCSKKILGPF